MYKEKTKNNKIRYVVSYIDDSGKTKKVSKVFDKDNKQNRKLAEEYLNKKISQNLTIKEEKMRFLDKFNEYVEYKKTTIKPTTYTIFLSITTFIINNALNWDLKELSAKNINSMFSINEKNKKRKLTEIKLFLKWCYENEYIEDITFLDRVKQRNITVKKEKKLYLEREEIKEILS